MKDHVVIVTGATGALGTAVASALTAAGAFVVGTYVQERELPRFEAALASAKGRYALHATDVTDEASVDALFAAVAKTHGRLDGLVHVAGGFAMGPIEETAVATWDAQMALNAKSFFLFARGAVRAMKPKKQGRIVAIGSKGGLEPGAKTIVYGASKAALHALVRGLGEELKGTGLSVNAVLPSTIDTPANRAAMPNADFGKWVAPSAIATTILSLLNGSLPVTSGALLPVYGDG
jgi:NAD(P)-dependent dehydrogenase (short-subunit alcohol dehydrogenase family)